MAFTGTNVLDEVRPLVADTDNTNYRWTDDQILVKINSAILEIFSLRPDAANPATVEPPSSVILTSTIALRDLFRPAVVYHAASALLMERSSDKSLRTQGADFRKMYTQTVGA